MQIPDDVMTKVRARIDSGHNVGKIIWVERHVDGHWLIHANGKREAERRMAVALETGGTVFANPAGSPA